MSRNERLVCFDLGGVLIRICRSWEEGCKRAGIDPNRGWSPSGSNGRHMSIVRDYTIGAIGTDEFLQSLERASGAVYSVEEFRRIHDAWTMDPYPGVVDLINKLHQAGTPLACLSNTNESHWSKLVTQAPVTTLRHQHASHLIGRAKPDEEIFHWFVRNVDVSPEQIVFFDDLADNVAAAKRVGWDAVQVDHQGDTAGQIEAALRRRELM